MVPFHATLLKKTGKPADASYAASGSRALSWLCYQMTGKSEAENSMARWYKRKYGLAEITVPMSVNPKYISQQETRCL
jgi:hypothetical protein